MYKKSCTAIARKYNYIATQHNIVQLFHQFEDTVIAREEKSTERARTSDEVTLMSRSFIKLASKRTLHGNNRLILVQQQNIMCFFSRS
jgi:hypothetical protein